jgi:hypothetical protein
MSKRQPNRSHSGLKEQIIEDPECDIFGLLILLTEENFLTSLQERGLINDELHEACCVLKFFRFRKTSANPTRVTTTLPNKVLK